MKNNIIFVVYKFFSSFIDLIITFGAGLDMRVRNGQENERERFV